MNTIEALHLFAGVILCGFLAALMTFLLEEPAEKAMSTVQVYLRSFRNVLITICTYSSVGVLVGFIINPLFQINKSGFPENIWVSWAWVLVSVFCWLLGPKLLYTVSTNSVLRATNYLSTSRRKLPKGMGIVDNAVKWPGPLFAILNPFDKNQGIVDTESLPDITKSFDKLKFLDDNGTGVVSISVRVSDVDAFAQGGTTNANRIARINAAIELNVLAFVESKLAKTPILEAQIDAPGLSRRLTDEYNEELTDIELKLGVEVEYIEVSKINESERLSRAIEAIGITAKVKEAAAILVAESKASGDKVPLAFTEAMYIALTLTDNAKIDMTQFSLHIKGLENAHDINIGAGPLHKLVEYASNKKKPKK